MWAASVLPLVRHPLPRHGTSARRRTLRLLPLLVGVSWLSSAGVARAQFESVPPPDPPYEYGSVSVFPALVFSTGHDTNPYHEPSSTPNFETFVVPQVAAYWEHPGFRVRGLGAVEFIRFGDQQGPTTKNSQAGVRIERTNAMVRPFVGLNHRQTYAAVTGFEIGYKSSRLENELSGGAAVNLTPRTSIRLSTSLTQTRWDAAAIYQSSSLKEKLNRDTALFGASIDYPLTALSSIGGTVDVIRDRFLFSPERDGNTLRAAAVVSFAQPALISGNASIGFQHFVSPLAGTADFNGLIAAVNLASGSPEGTLLRLTITRQTEYSFDAALGYYVFTGINPTVARHIGGNWDVNGFYAYQLLDYTKARTAAAQGKKDRVLEYGGALVYRTTTRTRVGATVEHSEKNGADAYRSLRVTAFLMWGAGPFQRLDRPTPLER